MIGKSAVLCPDCPGAVEAVAVTPLPGSGATLFQCPVCKKVMTDRELLPDPRPEAYTSTKRRWPW